MAKVLITGSFHRFVPDPASTAEKPLKEIRENFPKGKTIEDASEEDAETWIAQDNAKLAE